MTEHKENQSSTGDAKNSKDIKKIEFSFRSTIKSKSKELARHAHNRVLLVLLASPRTSFSGGARAGAQVMASASKVVPLTVLTALAQSVTLG